MKTIQECAMEALQVQNACNLSGVVHSFGEVMQSISDYAFEHGKGTDWKNNHPIVIAFIDKLSSLASVQCLDCRLVKMAWAYKECERLAEGESTEYEALD